MRTAPTPLPPADARRAGCAGPGCRGWFPSPRHLMAKDPPPETPGYCWRWRGGEDDRRRLELVGLVAFLDACAAAKGGGDD